MLTFLFCKYISINFKSIVVVKLKVFLKAIFIILDFKKDSIHFHFVWASNSDSKAIF